MISLLLVTAVGRFIGLPGALPPTGPALEPPARAKIAGFLQQKFADDRQRMADFADRFNEKNQTILDRLDEGIAKLRDVVSKLKADGVASDDERVKNVEANLERLQQLRAGYAALRMR